MCSYVEPADVTDNIVKDTANWVVERINDRLKPVTDNHCELLKVDRLLDAEYVIPNDVVSILIAAQNDRHGYMVVSGQFQLPSLHNIAAFWKDYS